MLNKDKAWHFLSGYATLSGNGHVIGEGWSDTSFNTNSWDTQTVSPNTWTDVSFNSNSWNEIIGGYYVLPDYWIEGYTYDTGNYWETTSTSSNTWLRQG